jgi:hypothetical protein
MTANKQHSEPSKKRKADLEIRDLKPPTDPKAGAAKPRAEGKGRAVKTGEIDFMKEFR